MSKTIEELLNAPYWIIDILPKQVPAGSAGQYFAIEQYLRDTQLSDIKKKHVNLILKLNCYRDISFLWMRAKKSTFLRSRSQRPSISGM